MSGSICGLSSILGHSEGGEWVTEEAGPGDVEEEEAMEEEGDEENEGEGENI